MPAYYSEALWGGWVSVGVSVGKERASNRWCVDGAVGGYTNSCYTNACYNNAY